MSRLKEIFGGGRSEEAQQQSFTHSFEWSEETEATMSNIARVTGREGVDAQAQVISDALKVYEWILTKQAAGRMMITADKLPNGVHTQLASLIPAGKMAEAKEIFRDESVKQG